MKTCSRLGLKRKFSSGFVLKFSSTSNYHLNFMFRILLAIFVAQPSHGSDRAQIITNLEVAAEIEFLDSDLTNARKTYKKIVQMALDQVWTDKIRTTIYQAHYRMAQLDKTNADKWVMSAIAFAPDFQPNNEITPRNLVDKYKMANLNSLFVEINKSKLEKVLINSSKHISKVHKNKIYRLDSITNPNLKPKFVKGNQIDNYDENSFKATLVAIDHSKKQNQEQERETKLALHLPQKKFLKSKLELNLASKDFKSHTNNFKTAGFKTKNKIKEKNNDYTWIYVASSILAVTLGAVLISDNNDNSKPYEPSQSKGF